jgi:dihydrofolate reductase
MKKVLLITISPNGYIARKNDEAPWSAEEFARCSNLANKMGNLVVGHKTYEIMKEAGDFDDSIQTVVLSKKRMSPAGNVTFVNTPADALAFLSKKSIPIALIGGGAATNTAFLKAGLIDEILLDVAPLVFCDGIPLFLDKYEDLKLSLVDSSAFSDGTVRLQYKVEH